MEPIPTGRYQGEKTDNAVSVRLSPNGVNYLNANWRTLIETFAPGAKLSFPVNCTKQTVDVIGDVWIADQGGPNGGRQDSNCDSRDEPAMVDVTVTGFSLAPQAPDTIDVSVKVVIDTGKIYLAKGCVRCSIRFDTSRAAPADNQISADVRFTIDTRWDKLLSFSVVQIGGTGVCGSPKGSCLDPDDLDLRSDPGCNFCCSDVCDLGGWGPIKEFILRMMSPMLQARVREAVEKQTVEPCGTGKPPCPRVGAATSRCDASESVCFDNAAKTCASDADCRYGTCSNGTCNRHGVPRFLGVEGRISPASLLGSFGAPPQAKLDMSMAAGSSVTVDQGFSLGTRGGLKAVEVANCVPPIPAPPIVPVPPPNFDAEADTSKGPYHVGLGISSSFLNQATHHAHQAGVLCLQISSANTGLLNTGLFKTFLPSLGKLATRDGKDAPMMIVLRPAKAPTITIGQGTYDPVTKKPIKPLILMTMPDVTVDFYAMIDDRFARLFSLTADISLPLSLIFEKCDSVTPALGDLKQLITNIRTANSEMLAEDPKVLADLIPAVIGLAEPALASALKPFALPQLGNFKLKVNETKGLANIAGTETYNHLGIYAQLLPANAACAVGAPTAVATLKKSLVPSREQMRLLGQPLPWPTAVLDVRALGMSGTPEFSVRVDNGLWSTFLAPNAQGELEVSHPAFLIQGQHVIEVRARMAESPHGVSGPASVGFRVDWEPPEVSLVKSPSGELLEVVAHDVISPPDSLTYAYRVGHEPWSDFGPKRSIDLAAIEAAGGVEVRVRDEAGNVGEAIWRAPAIAERPESVEGVAPETAAFGCSAAAGLLTPLALLSLARLLRRRSR